jgi:dethiobiotin synthetase
MGKAIFITATGTEVGKTYVSSKIAQALIKSGINTGVFKPISTGDRRDAKSLINAAKSSETPETVTPVFFNNPMSPYGASKLENRQVDFNKIYISLKYFLSKYEFTIVEGIGGLLVPLKKNFFVSDLIKKMNLPTIVVARRDLGTINHTLLTVDKLKRNKQKVLGIVLNGKKNKSDVSTKSNAAIIRELTRLPVLELGYNEKIDLRKNKWIIK